MTRIKIFIKLKQGFFILKHLQRVVNGFTESYFIYKNYKTVLKRKYCLFITQILYFQKSSIYEAITTLWLSRSFVILLAIPDVSELAYKYSLHKFNFLAPLVSVSRPDWAFISSRLDYFWPETHVREAVEVWPHDYLHIWHHLDLNLLFNRAVIYRTDTSNGNGNFNLRKW